MQTKIFNTSSPGYAANVWIIDKDTLGWRPDGTHGAHQVTASGLDGGKYKVEIRLPGDPEWKVGAYGPPQLALIVNNYDTVMIQSFRVTVSALGGSAVPVVTVTSRLKGFA